MHLHIHKIDDDIYSRYGFFLCCGAESKKQANQTTHHVFSSFSCGIPRLNLRCFVFFYFYFWHLLVHCHIRNSMDFFILRHLMNCICYCISIVGCCNYYFTFYCRTISISISHYRQSQRITLTILRNHLGLHLKQKYVCIHLISCQI